MKAVIFDLDGTLIDSMHMWKNLGKTFLNQKNLILTDEVSQKMSTMSLSMSSKYLKEYYNLKDSSEKIYSYFEEIILDFYINHALPKENSFETLKTYHELDYKVVLGTATNYSFLKPVIEKFDLEKYFDFIQTVEDVKIGKNESKYFKLISERLLIDPEEIFLFDDAKFALNAAKNIGIKTVAVYDYYSHNHWNEIKKENDFAIESFSDWEIK